MKNVRVLALFFLFFLVANSNAQDPPPPENLTGQELRDWLKDNWFEPFHASVGYNTARQEMYSDIDNESGRVYCVYSGFNQEAQFTTFLNPINAEHTVPQLLFDGNEPMRSDVHHVFPTHMDVNSARGNLSFGESEDAQTDNWYIGDDMDLINNANIPLNDIELYSERDINIIFEPKEDHKGDVARAVFYFYTMYSDVVGNISQVGDINELHQWHLGDLPDAKEILRNEKIKDLQGNYNPYVNLPELVSLAWDLPSGNSELNFDFKIFPNPSQIELNVESAAKIENLELLDLNGKHIKSASQKTINVQDVPSGSYLLKICTTNNFRFKVVCINR